MKTRISINDEHHAVPFVTDEERAGDERQSAADAAIAADDAAKFAAGVADAEKHEREVTTAVASLVENCQPSDRPLGRAAMISRSARAGSVRNPHAAPPRHGNAPAPAGVVEPLVHAGPPVGRDLMLQRARRGEYGGRGES